jgi:hypothetical protein
MRVAVHHIDSLRDERVRMPRNAGSTALHRREAHRAQVVRGHVHVQVACLAREPNLHNKSPHRQCTCQTKRTLERTNRAHDDANNRASNNARHRTLSSSPWPMKYLWHSAHDGTIRA